MKNNKNGFALPTVLVASIVMLMVLLVAVVSTSAVRSSLNSQYYGQLAKTAAEAGVTYAKACLDLNGNIPKWTDAKPLTPKTNCSGDTINGATDLVLQDALNKLTTTFSVGCSGCSTGQKLYDISAAGTTNLLRSDGSQWRQYVQTARLGGFEVKMSWKQVSAGNTATCGIDSVGRVYCWGSGYIVPDGFADVPKFVDFSGVTPSAVTAISLGVGHACAIAGGKAYCWGDNDRGRLGNPTITNDTPSPVPVNIDSGLSGKTVTDISAANDHTCAVADGRAYCWGSDYEPSYGTPYYNQLGTGSVAGGSVVPALVMADGALRDKTVTKISAGYTHTCAVADGRAYCWGNNQFGQLGTRNTTGAYVPIAVDATTQPYFDSALLGKTVLSVSAGYMHTCAITADAANNAACWGLNSFGEVSIPVATNPANYPRAVSGAIYNKKVINISAGGDQAYGGGGHTCAIDESGSAYCWGKNYLGKLGKGDATNTYIPSYVISGSGYALNGRIVKFISAGVNHNCAVDNQGSAYCWGDNRFRQLGDQGTSGDQSAIPVVTFGPPATAIYF